MFLQQLHLTTALRPELLPDETLLFVQDAVALYHGYRIPEYQNGHAYLTSHRACYVDNDEPRKAAVAVDLKHVDKADFYAGFLLKSSPKVTLYPKPARNVGLACPAGPHHSPHRSLTASPVPPPVQATWICSICSHPNPVPTDFDPATANARTPISPCLQCGVKPDLVHIVKATINAMSKRPLASQSADLGRSGGAADSRRQGAFPCPRCTFENHPSLLACEICGASLVSAPDRRLDLEPDAIDRTESAGPSMSSLSLKDDNIECIKFSFRAGGEKIFHERLKNALVQRKWLLQSAPPVPQPSVSKDGVARQPESTIGGSILDRNKVVGIAGLERRDQETRKQNELILGNAFEDLEALMTSAKEVIALAERFAHRASDTGAAADANLVSQSASTLGLVTTKDMLGPGAASDTLYVSELSRNLAEFLTDDGTGVLRRDGGIMSLVDLWAVFNRARGGLELVSPLDFANAARLWGKLRLPVRLCRFKSGLLVVQGRDRTDEKTIAALLALLQTWHHVPPDPDERVTWDWLTFGRGVTAQEVAEHFGWSLGVATEELEMAEERGALCREHEIDGIRFWENWLVELQAS